MSSRAGADGADGAGGRCEDLERNDTGQEGQPERRAHADFMNALEAEGLVVLGGPLVGTPDVPALGGITRFAQPPRPPVPAPAAPWSVAATAGWRMGMRAGRRAAAATARCRSADGA
jgi:hypothetical protein